MLSDSRRVLWAQALRAFAYGLGAVVLGGTLKARGFSSVEAGVVLAAVVAGTVVASLGVARFGDRLGRRRCYVGLYLALGVTGVAFALSDDLWLLVAVALAGALSTEVVESGPFTSLEQAMLATDLDGRRLVRGFGVYNAVATTGGSLGALAAAGLRPLRHAWAGAPSDQHALLLFVPVAAAGALVALGLSPGVEAHRSRPSVSGAVAPARGSPPPLGRSRPSVVRLAALFAADSFGGGFVVQAFVAYWLSVRFHASVSTLGLTFFAMGILQTASFLAAPRLAERFGLLPTMVFTHLPSNLLLAAVAVAPDLGVAIGLLLARTALSQMDVPTRQAYVMTLVDAPERTAAAAYTNTVRYLVRPPGPALAGALQSVALGAPFVVAGAIKCGYDVALWRWFRRVRLPEEASW